MLGGGTPPLVSTVAISTCPVLATIFFVVGLFPVAVISPPKAINPPSSGSLCCLVVARFVVGDGGSVVVVGCLQLVNVGLVWWHTLFGGCVFFLFAGCFFSLVAVCFPRVGICCVGLRLLLFLLFLFV